MPIQVVTVGEPEWFAPRGQADEDPTEFFITGLDGYGQAQLAPELSILESGNLQFSARGIRILLEGGILDFRNLVDADGKSIDFKSTSAAQLQRMLAYPVQIQLATEIFSRTQLAPDDKKKS